MGKATSYGFCQSRSHAGLPDALGDVPGINAAYRFSVKLREHCDMLTACTDRVLANLPERLPEMGGRVHGRGV